MRQSVPLPSRQTLFRHFQLDLIEEAMLLTDPEQIEENLRACCTERGVPSVVVVAVDATGASDTDETGGAGYLWLVLVLSTDPAWCEFVAQVAPSAHGNHRHVVDLGDAVCFACARIGMTVRLLAADGDKDLDQRTRNAFALWEKFLVAPGVQLGGVAPSLRRKARPAKDKGETPMEPGPVSLKKIVSWLDREGSFLHWPLHDMMHLLKNVKQRFRNHELTLGPGRPRISGLEFSAALGGVPGLETLGTSNSISDGLATNLMSPEVCLAASDLDEQEAARFLMPWALLQMAIRAEGMSR
jgi:hypothetical protein